MHDPPSAAEDPCRPAPGDHPADTGGTLPVVARAQLVGVLQQALHALDCVDAAWEGGSAAFGTHDDLSDIDAVAIVADEAVEATFLRVEAALQALSPVSLRVDTPGTVGFAQKFYRLRDATESLMVDLVLIRRSDPLLFREVEIHGHGRTWFDRRGVLLERHLDVLQDLEQARARVAPLGAAFLMFQHLVTKESRRGRAVDALAFYQAMTLRPLVEALRLLHCPQRRMFGLRYLARDLPAEACRRVEHLAFVRDVPDLALKHEQARQWFAQCMERLQAHGPGAGLDGVRQG
jgi:predicted nucleotidyltransferase